MKSKNCFLLFYITISFIITTFGQNKSVNFKEGDVVKAAYINQVTSAQKAAALIYGKYSCTATKYSNGSYEYIPRGSFTITKGGKYTYNGFSKPSTGTFTIDKNGNLFFKGGYFNGGKAEKIDRPNKFFLTFPTNPDKRWTCSLIE